MGEGLPGRGGSGPGAARGRRPPRQGPCPPASPGAAPGRPPALGRTSYPQCRPQGPRAPPARGRRAGPPPRSGPVEQGALGAPRSEAACTAAHSVEARGVVVGRVQAVLPGGGEGRRVRPPGRIGRRPRRTRGGGRARSRTAPPAQGATSEICPHFSQGCSPAPRTRSTVAWTSASGGPSGSVGVAAGAERACSAAPGAASPEQAPTASAEPRTRAPTRMLQGRPRTAPTFRSRDE